MDGIPELADAIYRERIQRARTRSIEQKVMLGGDLFDTVRERMIWGIKGQFPEFDDAQVQAEFVRRLKLSRRLERFS